MTTFNFFLENFLHRIEYAPIPLDLNTTIQVTLLKTDKIETLIRVITHLHCPENLEVWAANAMLDLRKIAAIANALESGQCCRGLKLHLGRNNIGIAGAMCFEQAIASGRCPENLGLYLPHTNLGQMGKEAILRALQSGNYPPGLSLNFFDGSNRPEDIDQILRALQHPRIKRPLGSIRIHDFFDNNYKYDPIAKQIAAINASYKRAVEAQTQNANAETTEEGVQCPVCLMPLNDPFDTRPQYTPICKHRIHMKCLEKWVRAEIGKSRGDTCPICRNPI